MSLLITFTGAQSTGKSTLLEKMRNDERFKYWSFEAEITRDLLKKYDLKINEDGDVFTQYVTCFSHVDNYLRNRDKHAVFDRCAIDSFIYTTYAYHTSKNSAKDRDNMATIATAVLDLLYDKYDIIFYTSPDIPLVADGVRSPNEDYRNKIIELFEDYIQEFAPKNLVRLTGTVDERYSQIIKAVDAKL